MAELPVGELSEGEIPVAEIPVAEIPVAEIPVIDIAPFLSGDDLEQAPSQIEAAASTVGFFQVVGHGVPEHLLAAVYDRLDELAAQSEREKRRHLTDGHPYRGFHMNRDESGAVRQERFLASRFDSPDDAIAGGVDQAYADYFHPNVWPDVEGFREAVTALFEATRHLARQMMSICAVALGLAPDHFEAAIVPDSSTFAINHYPARGESFAGEPPILFAEHADGNTLTLLHQRADYNGLQLLPYGGSGEWLHLPVVPEAFAVNIGELMTRWTNDHWPATRHRVVASRNPEHVRTTLTTFHMPKLSAVVSPLAVLGGKDDPHYDPVTPYDWERIFMARIYQRQALRLDDRVRDFVAALND